MFRLFSLLLLSLLVCNISNVFADDLNLGEFTFDLDGGNETDTNFTYQANPVAQNFHNIPHFNRDGTIIQNPQYFSAPAAAKSPEDIKKAKDYIDSILPFPIILGCFGLIAVICLELGILGYFDWLVPKLGPKELDPEDETITAIALYTHANEVSRKNWLLYFSVSLFIAFFGTNFMWYGQVLFTKGFRTYTASLNDIADRLVAIGVGVADLKSRLVDTQTLADQAARTTCPEASGVNDNLVALNNQLAAFNDQTLIIAVYADDMADEFSIYNERKDAVLYSVYFITMAMLISFFSVFFFKKQIFMRYTIIVAEFAMIVLIVLATFEFIFMMYMSDFCMDPMKGVVQGLGGMGIIQQSAKFYGNHRNTGLNPIHRNLATSYLLRDSIGKELVKLFDYASNPSCPCRSDRTTIDAFRALQSMHSGYEGLAELMDYDTVHKVWNRIFELALCTNTMGGMVGLWVAGMITSLGLFLVAITSSVLMLYFDEFWELEHRMEDKVNHIREDNKNLLSDSEGNNSDTDTGDDKNVRV